MNEKLVNRNMLNRVFQFIQACKKGPKQKNVINFLYSVLSIVDVYDAAKIVMKCEDVDMLCKKFSMYIKTHNFYSR